MPNMFNSLDDVERYVRQDVSGNGKAMLMLQLAMGSDVFGADSRKYAEEWLARDDARLEQQERERRESEALDLRVREVRASEVQAKSSREATRIAWLALVVSVLGACIALAALFK